jgi:hypothetical protein
VATLVALVTLAARFRCDWRVDAVRAVDFLDLSAAWPEEVRRDGGLA